jgi:hypothetical protein
MESVLDNGADTQTFYDLFFQTNYPLWLWNTMFVAVTATLRRPAAGCRSIAEQICTLIYVLVVKRPPAGRSLPVGVHR